MLLGVKPQLLHNVHMVKFSCNVNNFSSETTNSFVGLKEAEKPTSDYILPIIQKMDHKEKIIWSELNIYMSPTLK